MPTNDDFMPLGRSRKPKPEVAPELPTPEEIRERWSAAAVYETPQDCKVCGLRKTVPVLPDGQLAALEWGGELFGHIESKTSHAQCAGYLRFFVSRVEHASEGAVVDAMARRLEELARTVHARPSGRTWPEWFAEARRRARGMVDAALGRR